MRILRARTADRQDAARDRKSAARTDDETDRQREEAWQNRNTLAEPCLTFLFPSVYVKEAQLFRLNALTVRDKVSIIFCIVLWGSVLIYLRDKDNPDIIDS